MKAFRDLNVWEKSHQLVLLIYKVTGKLPSGEKFNLVSQIRRFAMPIVGKHAKLS